MNLKRLHLGANQNQVMSIVQLPTMISKPSLDIYATKCTSRNFKTSIALSISICTLVSLLNVLSVACSPPIDYLVYTSQLAKAQAGTQRVESLLPSLKSIYAPPQISETPSSWSEFIESKELEHLFDLSKKVMQLVKNESHTHDNNMVDLETTRYAWYLMERQASLYTQNLVSTLKPFVDELLAESNASAPCQESIKGWLINFNDLKQWATLMWNSWGQFPPSGVYEGSFTDHGSYRSCINIKDNDIIGQSQYCTLDFQPIVPSRPRFHSIYKKILSLDDQNRLIGGDYNIEDIGSHHTSHEISSKRFRESTPFSGTHQGHSNESLQSGKYSKRTIDNNLTNHETVKNHESLNITKSNFNFSLKAEALIELASQAQYFYYVRFRIGSCFPSKCSEKDVLKLAQAAGLRAVLQANQVNCMKKEPVILNNYQRVAIWILSTLALVAILGTIIDLVGFKEASGDSYSFVNWLMPFSMWTNSRRLFNYDTAGTHGDLECVHGLRFFSMIWVIYGHTILYTEYQSFTHFYDVVERQIPNFLLLPSLNANFSVDTFFVISGMLTTYVTWEYTKGDPRKFNKFAFLISRYIRLTPQLAIVILCFFLLPLFGDGPMYKQVAEDKAEVCYKNWGINLLYLQSYINADKLCIDPSWWLSIEMTFHLISMVIIIVMIQNPTKGMLINVVIATVMTLWGVAIHYTNGFAIQYLPSIPQRYEVPAEQTKWFFHRPYPHAASYFIGIALGYMLANKTVKKLTSSQVYQGWTVCGIGIFISLWGSYYWNLGAPYSQLQSTLYYHLCQILWPVSVAWIIFAGSLGHGGVVDLILSAKCFVPLGRITYMTYLSHALIIYFHSASLNIPIEPSMLLFVYLFIANTVLSLGLGIILTIVYESPILNLQKMLFSYLTEKFESSIEKQKRQPPVTILCDKNGTSAATVMLLTKTGEPINCNGNSDLDPMSH